MQEQLSSEISSKSCQVCAGSHLHEKIRLDRFNLEFAEMNSYIVFSTSCRKMKINFILQALTRCNFKISLKAKRERLILILLGFEEDIGGVADWQMCIVDHLKRSTK